MDAAHVRIGNPQGIPILLFAGIDVPVERAAIEQLLSFASLAQTLEALNRHRFFGDATGELARIVLTPDFHRGAGIPVGTVADARSFVVPKAIGNDIGCGMRLLVTDLPAEALAAHRPAVARRLRALFFGGERDIPMSPRQREAILRNGLTGLLETYSDNSARGLWKHLDVRSARDDLERVHANGTFPTHGLFGFDGFVRSSGRVDGRDPQIGSVGGGNHFVELQRVAEVLDGAVAHFWGIRRDSLAIMVHSGSVGIGHAIGGHFMAEAQDAFPRTLRHPAHGFYPLPASGASRSLSAAYLDAMHNAANFAYANRLFLGLMALRAIREATGRTVSARLVYDAPHNLVFPGHDGERFLHRKGATPAGGPATADAWIGEPVIIPGSMGASSFLLAGCGQEASLSSACHGAGRALSRGAATHVNQAMADQVLAPLEVVTPIDPNAPLLRTRRDILDKYRQRILEEAPFAYKAIGPVIRSVQEAGIAQPVVRLEPIATVKG
ncbi:MAG: RtcB family protein [Deltaproteobacteria bacterium]|nr:RtcB family protein [Deltaproteobacteria bacterium]